VVDAPPEAAPAIAPTELFDPELPEALLLLQTFATLCCSAALADDCDDDCDEPLQASDESSAPVVVEGEASVDAAELSSERLKGDAIDVGAEVVFGAAVVSGASVVVGSAVVSGAAVVSGGSVVSVVSGGRVVSVVESGEGSVCALAAGTPSVKKRSAPTAVAAARRRSPARSLRFVIVLLPALCRVPPGAERRGERSGGRGRRPFPATLSG